MSLLKNINNKKVIIIGLIIFIIVTLFIMGANGDSKVDRKTGKVEFKMTGNKNFTGNINVTYFDKDGYNIVFRLNRYNDYFTVVSVPAGKYKLSNIEISKGYKADVFEEIEVVENRLLTVDIAVNDEDKIKDTKELKDKNAKLANNTKESKLIKKEVVQKNYKESKKENNKFLKVGNSGIFTLIVFAVLIIALIYTKALSEKCN